MLCRKALSIVRPNERPDRHLEADKLERLQTGEEKGARPALRTGKTLPASCERGRAKTQERRGARVATECDAKRDANLPPPRTLPTRREAPLNLGVLELNNEPNRPAMMPVCPDVCRPEEGGCSRMSDSPTLERPDGLASRPQNQSDIRNAIFGPKTYPTLAARLHMCLVSSWRPAQEFDAVLPR